MAKIIYQQNLELTPVLSVLAASIILLLLFRRKRIIELKNVDIHKKSKLFLRYFLFFILANIILIYFLNFAYVTPDSWNYMVAGEIIVKAGQFPFPEIPIPNWEGFLTNRMAFLPMIYTGSYLFNVDFYYSLFPLSAIYFLLAFPQLFLIASEPMNLPRQVRLSLGYCCSLLIVSVPAYWYHFFYVNNNLIVSTFFSFCLVSIFIYKYQRNRLWLVFSALSLSVTALQRAEMSLLAVIPVIMLIGTENLEKKDYKLFLLVFLSISFSWQIFRTYHLGSSMSFRGSGLPQMIVHLSYTLSYLIIH